MDERGKLQIMSTGNQDSPLMYGLRPILGIDLCEHAYYLKYRDRRERYVAAWWRLINWDNVSGLYDLYVEQTGAGRPIGHNGSA